jgi:hypothetical protein
MRNAAIATERVFLARYTPPYRTIELHRLGSGDVRIDTDAVDLQPLVHFVSERVHDDSTNEISEDGWGVENEIVDLDRVPYGQNRGLRARCRIQPRPETYLDPNVTCDYSLHGDLGSGDREVA